MFEKLLHGKKSTKKEIEFDLFDNFLNQEKAQSLQSIKNVQSTFNFDISNGALRSGYGFEELKMPTSTTDLANQETIKLDGTQICSIWSLVWYDQSSMQYKYYVVYFNEKNKLGFANLFSKRPVVLSVETQFENTPIGCQAKYKGNDALIFSTEAKQGIHLLSGSVSSFFDQAPSISSICCHYDNLYAITSGGREKLVFSQNQEVTDWSADDMEEIKFNDALGRLNRVLTLDDYVYVIRDFGINRISFYSTRGTYDLSQIYQSDSYIFPQTIASSGDKIYFLDGRGLCSFNGSSVTHTNLECDQMLAKADKTHACGVCFEGKYFLACRYDFDDGQKLGCEEEEYVNNCLFVFDLAKEKVNLCRGVDISSLCALSNPYKSKVVASFNGKNKGKIGEITKSGRIFDQVLPKVWKSVKSDFGQPEKLKTVKYICLKSTQDCSVTLQSEKASKTIQVPGSDRVQRYAVQLCGKEISLGISAQNDGEISNVKIGVNLV